MLFLLHTHSSFPLRQNVHILFIFSIYLKADYSIYFVSCWHRAQHINHICLNAKYLSFQSAKYLKKRVFANPKCANAQKLFIQSQRGVIEIWTETGHWNECYSLMNLNIYNFYFLDWKTHLKQCLILAQMNKFAQIN